MLSTYRGAFFLLLNAERFEQTPNGPIQIIKIYHTNLNYLRNKTKC